MTTTTVLKPVTHCCLICGTTNLEEAARNCETCGALCGDAHKAIAQLKKALKLHDTVVALGGDATKVLTFPEITLRLAEKVAGVSESSEVTWAMVAFLGRTDTAK